MKKVLPKCTKGFQKKKFEIEKEIIILVKALLSESPSDIAYILQLMLNSNSSMKETLTYILAQKTKRSDGEPLSLVGLPVLLEKRHITNSAWSEAKKVGNLLPAVVIEQNPFASYVKVEYLTNNKHIAIRQVTEIYTGYLIIHKIIEK